MRFSTGLWALALVFVSCATVRAEGPRAAKPIDSAMVGNFEGTFYPPQTFGGLSTKVVWDVDPDGRYMAINLDLDIVLYGKFEAADGQWKFTGDNGAVAEGKYQIVDDLVITYHDNGHGWWTRTSAKSRQATLRDRHIDPKSAEVESFLAPALEKARSAWQKDARLIMVDCHLPNADGTVDLTRTPSAVQLIFYSPSKQVCQIVRISLWGDANLVGSPENLPPGRTPFPLPPKLTSLKAALATFRGLKANAVQRAMLFGTDKDDPIHAMVYGNHIIPYYFWKFIAEPGRPNDGGGAGTRLRQAVKHRVVAELEACWPAQGGKWKPRATAA